MLLCESRLLGQYAHQLIRPGAVGHSVLHSKRKDRTAVDDAELRLTSSERTIFAEVLRYRHEPVIRKMESWELSRLEILERGHCRSQVSHDELDAPVRHDGAPVFLAIVKFIGWQGNNGAA